MKDMKQSDIFLKIRDIKISFKNKGKKFTAVNETSLDIKKGEIFGLVGESGSGKTTIARAIVGVQNLSDGAIYMDEQIVAGKASSLYHLNTYIKNKIIDLENKLYSIVYVIKNQTKKLKNIYFNNKKKVTEIKYYSNRIINLTKIKFIDEVYEYILKLINIIVSKEERIKKFVNNIHLQVPEIPLELEKSILKKIEEVIINENALKLKIEEAYLLTTNFLKKWEENSKEKVQLNNYIKSFFVLFDFIVNINNDIFKNLNIVKTAHKENLLLTSPERIKNKLLPSYYKKIYVSRDDFIKECRLQINKLSQENNEFNNKKIKKYKLYLKDFWSNENISIKNCEKILQIYKLKDSINYDKLKVLSSKLKSTDFEINLKNKISNNIKLTDKELDEISLKFDYIKKLLIEILLKVKILLKNILNE
ncbi:ATP-binding cassette domain-containing protein [Spiroplasma helicoides]|uniref:ATP-binding cassette domain-containing protein n=1 Tax=Spiroplasma helicoides TaxID=216938 RepID=UPI00083F5181|nr:ATP-binding cassette domain-containing protein [Spiroplasma helicoides]